MGSGDSDRWALQSPFFAGGRIAETLNLHDDEFEFEVCVVPSPDVIRKVYRGGLYRTTVPPFLHESDRPCGGQH